nr:hypothetical protein CFP56_59640 [Quercus suber]
MAPPTRPNLTGFDPQSFARAAGQPANDPWARHEAWRYSGPFSRYNRFKGSFPGLGIATVAFAGYLEESSEGVVEKRSGASGSDCKRDGVQEHHWLTTEPIHREGIGTSCFSDHYCIRSVLYSSAVASFNCVPPHRPYAFHTATHRHPTRGSSAEPQSMVTLVRFSLFLQDLLFSPRPDIPLTSGPRHEQVAHIASQCRRKVCLHIFPPQDVTMRLRLSLSPDTTLAHRQPAQLS